MLKGFLPLPILSGAELQRDRLIIATDSLFVYNISNPVDPVIDGKTNLPGGDITTVSISSWEKYTYASYGVSFAIIEISNANVPKIVYDTTSLAFTNWYVVADSNIVLLGGESDGFYVMSNNLIATSVLASKNMLPSNFKLFQNYPNPFNPTTVISYQLSAVSFVTLKVYDILGSKVATLVNERQNAGRHVATFDGSRLASVVYFYRLYITGIENFFSTKKMLLLK